MGVAQDSEPSQDVRGWRQDDVIGLIRGKKGTRVVLKVKKADGLVREIAIVRDQVILEEGKAVDSVSLVYRGEILVAKRENVVARLSDGAFVGEMGFISGEPASATVTATADSELFCWYIDKLHEMFEKSPAHEARFNGILALDMARKLRE